MHEPVIHVDFQRRAVIDFEAPPEPRTLQQQVRAIQAANLPTHIDDMRESVERTRVANGDVLSASEQLRDNADDLVKGLRDLQDVFRRYFAELRREIGD